jgi:hypothetical protein
MSKTPNQPVILGGAKDRNRGQCHSQDMLCDPIRE